jgi:hypothetical protein
LTALFLIASPSASLVACRSESNPAIHVGPNTYNATGYLIGATNLIVTGCSEHCNHGESMTTVAMAMDIFNP